MMVCPDGDEIAAEEDRPDSKFSQQRDLRIPAGRAGGRFSERWGIWVQRTDDVLDVFYSSAEGVESRGKVAEWAAEGWEQPADWGSCLDWVAEQWGAVEGEGPLQGLLGQLQFGSRVGLVPVGALQLHSIHICVTSPSVKFIFMDSQTLSQSPK